MTIRDSYLIERMYECVDFLGDARVILDSNMECEQVDPVERDKKKTAFMTYHDVYWYSTMPFGLKNIRAAFLRTMDAILASVKWQTAILYLDCVNVLSNDAWQRIRQIEQVLRLMKEAGMRLKVKKCFSISSNFDDLGRLISLGKQQLPFGTASGIKILSCRTKLFQMRSYLITCKINCRFVPNFARVARPIIQRLKQGESFTFKLNISKHEAVDILKQRLVSTPVLALPRAPGQFTIDTDKRDYQVGCALLQKQVNGTLKPFGYWSGALTPAKKSYDVTKMKCLAVTWAVTLKI